MARVKRTPQLTAKKPRSFPKPPVNNEPQPVKSKPTPRNSELQPSALKRKDLAKKGFLERVKDTTPRIWCAHCDARNLTVIDAVRHYKDSHDAQGLEQEKPYWVFENYHNSRHGHNTASLLATIRHKKILDYVSYDEDTVMPDNPWTQLASELEDFKSPQVRLQVNPKVLEIAPEPEVLEIAREALEIARDALEISPGPEVLEIAHEALEIAREVLESAN